MILSTIADSLLVDTIYTICYHILFDENQHTTVYVNT
jgi:hypothetical protein